MSPKFQKEIGHRKAHEYLNRIMQSKGKLKATGFEKKGKETDDHDCTWGNR